MELEDYTPTDFDICLSGSIGLIQLIGDMELPQKFTLGFRIFLN